ncbi:hypothetical protein GCM10022197_31730 [Microlunatus spumicola]|uniref:Uncharacterized protein n=1 Tax=Microlunatus spumicola TaxID=81499 RepID=A0ABP6XW13_9ACTN
MSGPRAYALAVPELRGLVGATGTLAARVRALAERAYAPPAPQVRDRLGPIHRRVPGTPVVRPDDPDAADLELLLAGGPVPPDRAAATWRLVETAVAGLAWSSTALADADLPPGLLAPAGLALPPAPRLDAGWCPLDRAVTAPALAGWLQGRAGWETAAAQAGRPAPDLVVLGGPPG